MFAAGQQRMRRQNNELLISQVIKVIHSSTNPPCACARAARRRLHALTAPSETADIVFSGYIESGRLNAVIRKIEEVKIVITLSGDQL